jgi:hypothetical protein
MMASAPKVDSPQGRVLEDPWPIDGIHYQYIDVQNFYQKLASIETSFENESRANGPWILFTEVDEQAFATLQNSDHELSCLYTKVYDPHNYILWVKMESIFHSTATMAITRWMDREITKMNLNHDIIFTGTTNYELKRLDQAGNQVLDENGSVMILRKRADQTIHPFSVALPRTMKWPSFILEAAYTESRKQIGEDIRIWLLNSHNQVTFAMAAFVNRNQNVSIEEWRLLDRPTPYLKTRLIAEKVQGMSIDKPKPGQEPIVRGSLAIPFSKIFLRKPQGNETDLVMDRADIIEIARQVWRANSIMEARKQ